MTTIDYLVTTVGKSNSEIEKIVKQLNIVGNIIVGNQGMSKDELIIDKNIDGCVIRILNMKNRGVSKNRNALLLESNADFVTFLDDDIYYESNGQALVEKIINELNDNNCIRFNVVSDNNDRPIKQIRKKGFVGFRQLSSFGVWGCFYKRSFLVKNQLLFNENVGPGTRINHGEDGLFIKQFTELSKVYCIPHVAFHAKQEESTWHSENRNLEQELFSHGYNYYLIYGKKANLMSILFLTTHMNCYPKNTKYKTLRKLMKNGIIKAMEDTK